MNQSMVVYSVNPGDDYGNALVIQPDGKILVAGATHNGTDWDWYIVRLMPDGALDGTFGTGGIVTTDLRGFNDWGTSIALQPDGKIVFGSKSSNGTDTDFAVARYNPDGSLDGTFGTGGKVFTPIGSGNDDGSRVTLQPDGKIVLAGWYVNGTDDDFAVVRYNTDGSLDSSFGSGGIVVTRVGTGQDRISGVTVQPDGKIVVAGHSHNGTDLAVARYLPDGTLDQFCARYRSTGTTATNLNTTPRTVEITNTTAIFDGPMPDNVGVGDVLQYQVAATTYLAVIHGRASNTTYTAFSTNGTTPQAAVAGTTVQVFRAYTSLAKWESLDENDTLDNLVENFDASTDLVAAGTVMSVACYADGPDGYVDITGWTTGPDNYIRIFTPALPSEAGVSQRHAGVWDDNKFRIENTEDAISVSANYVRIDGLQLRSTDGDTADYAGVEITGSVGASEYHVSNTIIRGSNGTADVRIGINLFLAGSGVMKAWNNLIYDWTGGTGAGSYVSGILPDDLDFTFYLYNNTVVDNEHGLDSVTGTVIAKNNLVFGNTFNYEGVFDTSSTNNLSGPGADPDTPPTNARNGVAVTFVNRGADDYHLAPGDTGAQGFAADLSGDPNLAFADDIDGGLRATPWDIGADDAAAALATLSLEEHDLLQVGDRFAAATPVTDVLLRFRLTSAGTVNVDTVRVSFTTGSGVVNGDVTGGDLSVDVDNDGAITGADTLIQTGIDPSGGVITFTTNFPTSAAGVNYLVSATVSNLLGGDSTTFSLDATGIDTVESGVFKSGAIADAVHTQDSPAGGDVFYSVGTDTADLKTGFPNITIVGGVASLDGAQTENVGVGDEVDYGGGTITYIKSVLSPTQFVLHTPTGGVPGPVTSVTVNSIKRAFNTLKLAESDSPDVNHLTTTDLVAANAKLTWVVYNDSPFIVAGSTTISGYNTDAGHFITVTVADASQIASGVSQRHTGVAGTGALMDGSSVEHFGLVVQNDFTRVDGLELARFFDPLVTGSAAVRVTAANVLLENLLVYDFLSPMPFDHGIKTGIPGPVSFTIRNSIIYDGDNDGIYLGNAGDVVTVENCTFYDVDNGIRNDGTVTITNTISTANSVSFLNTNVMMGSNNMSNDATAPGPGSITGVAAIDQFVDIGAGTEDLHLKGISAAIDAATNLSVSFTNDIDGETRPATWDMGADERATASIYRSVGTTATNLNTGTETVEIVGATATFSGPMPDNIGVGDVLVYNSGGPRLAYIQGRTSSTVFTVEDGGVPTAASAGTAVEVYRAYTSLTNWESGSANTNILNFANVNPNPDLVSQNTVMMVPCYGDGEDTDSVLVSGWTTGPNNYIKIYTPTSTSEVGTSQRHDGKWDTTSAYRISNTVNVNYVITVQEQYVRIDGIQIDFKNDPNNTNLAWIHINDDGSGAAAEVHISNNIVRMT